MAAAAAAVSARILIDKSSVPAVYPIPSSPSSSTFTPSHPPPSSPSTPRVKPPTLTQKGHLPDPLVLPMPSPAPKSFKRLLRSPFEQTIRSATGSKGKGPTLPDDELNTITAKHDTSQVNVTETMNKEGTGRNGMLKRFETKMALRRTRKSTTGEHTVAHNLQRQDNLASGSESGKDQNRFRLAGFTSFVTPLQRQASLSSPALHIADNNKPSSSSEPPNRPLISPPVPLTPKRPSVSNVNPPASSRPRRKSRPDPLLPSSPSTPSLHPYTLSSSPANREPVSPPGPPPSTPSSRLGKRSSSGTAARSSLDQPQPLSSPNSSRTRSPSSSRIVTPRGFTSASTSSLNYSPSYSSDAIRRSSIDHRSSSPALPPSPPPRSPSRPRALSPTLQRLRATSPSTRLARHTNGSAASLSPAGPSIPMHREALRAATSLLCKEMLRPGQSTGLGIRESEEVEVRMRALARLERVWGKSGASTNGSATQVGVNVSTAGEERERRLFTEALRDGYVLCQ
jgi:hypothetical protein